MSGAQVIGDTEGQRRGWTGVLAAPKTKGPQLCELYRLINLSNPVNPILEEQEEPTWRHARVKWLKVSEAEIENKGASKLKHGQLSGLCRDVQKTSRGNQST